MHAAAILRLGVLGQHWAFNRAARTLEVLRSVEDCAKPETLEATGVERPGSSAFLALENDAQPQHPVDATDAHLERSGGI